MSFSFLGYVRYYYSECVSLCVCVLVVVVVDICRSTHTVYYILSCYDDSLQENIEATRIGLSKKNRKWLTTSYGDTVVKSVEHKPTICSGSTMGEQVALEQYLRAMVSESDETKVKLVSAKYI